MTMTFDEYRSQKAVNWSTLKHLRDRSPAAYRWSVDHPDDGDTSSRRWLRAVHSLALEPERFALSYVVYDGRRDKRTKAYKAFLAEQAGGRDVLTTDEFDRAAALANSLRDSDLVGSFFRAPGEAEVSLCWTDEPTGLLCKGRLDRVLERDPRGADRPVVVDLKTTGTIVDRRIAYMAARNGWHIQLAHYVAGLKACRGWQEVDALLIVVEDKPPYDCGAFWLDPDGALFAGEEERRELLTKLAECKAEDRWPGRYDHIGTLELPGWAFNEDPEEGVTWEVER